MKYISQHAPWTRFRIFLFCFFFPWDNASPFLVTFSTARLPHGSMANGIMTGRVTAAFSPGTHLALPFQDLKACRAASSQSKILVTHSYADTRALTPHRYESKTLPLQNGSYTAVTLSQQMYCARVSGRHAHVWLYIKGKRLQRWKHGCLRWNRTWASWTVQWFFGGWGFARLHDIVCPREPKYQSFFNSLQQPRGRRSCSRINSSRVIFILPQCPVCLIRQQFQANIWTHRIFAPNTGKKKKKTNVHLAKTRGQADGKTHARLQMCIHRGVSLSSGVQSRASQRGEDSSAPPSYRPITVQANLRRVSSPIFRPMFCDHLA